MADDSIQQTELVVLGGGPAGYVAAFHAADLGMNVTLVDADADPGGTCLHRGCIPSKSLLHVAKLLQEAKEANHWGIHFTQPQIDLDKLRTWKEGVVRKLTGGLTSMAVGRKVKHLRARGRFLSSNTLQLEPISDKHNVPNQLKFQKCILATGSIPAMPPMFRIDDSRIMDSTSALTLPDVPESLLVIGGGYIGLELGSVYAALGSRVSVVELTGNLLPGADRDLVKPLQKRLEKIFHAIHLNTKVGSLTPTAAGIEAQLEGDGVQSPQTFARVLVSVGRTPNSKNLGLENTKVELTERGFVKVDRQQRSTDPNILAIGDIAGEPMLAHKASREAKVAVELLHGEPAEFDNIAIPAVVFTDPEVAWCGITEAEAKAKGLNIKVFSFPWSASGRAMTVDRTDGLTKIIADAKTERVLGVGIVGVNAGELIGEAVLAVENAMVTRELADTIHAHPTLAETVMESAEGILGFATHLATKKH